MFFDSHCHLSDEKLVSQLPAVLERAHDAGVTQILAIATDLDDAEKILGFADGQNVFATVGVHPQQALSWTLDSAARLEKLAGRPHVAAIGEIGLDWLYTDKHPDFPGVSREWQTKIFEAQLEIAADCHLPVVIHNRLADEELLEIVARHRDSLVGGVFHCFGSAPEIARRVLDLDFYLGFTGLVTFKNAEAVRESLKICPRDRVLIETDAPYLAPAPHRGQTNEPAFVALVGERIGEIWGVSGEEVGQITGENARRLFGI